jgi:hypothetical protein
VLFLAKARSALIQGTLVLQARFRYWRAKDRGAYEGKGLKNNHKVGANIFMSRGLTMSVPVDLPAGKSLIFSYVKVASIIKLLTNLTVPRRVTNLWLPVISGTI